MALNQNLNLLCFHSKRHTAFGTNFEAKRDGFLNILKGLFAGLALTDATGNGGTLGYPYAILIAV